MIIRYPSTPVVLCCAILLAGCALPHWPRFSPDLKGRTDIPLADPRFEHFSAWIPVSVAPTATVAQAMMQVALGKARLQADLQFCGTILPTSRTVSSVGPLEIQQLTGEGKETYWYYRVSQQPVPQRCGKVNPAAEHRFLRAHLPDWIQITPAHADARAVGLLDSE